MRRASALWAVLTALALLAGTVPALLSPPGASAQALPVFAPDAYTPVAGPRFNDPRGNADDQRRILIHVTRTVDSVPGYRVSDPRRCPTDPTQYPARIEIAVYSINDLPFARSLVRADQRCVSVRVVTSRRFNARTSPALGRLIDALGTDRRARSFVYRCMRTCRGGVGSVHAKLYLFSAAGGARDTVMVGSSNMTGTAARVQWNDLYTVNGEPALYDGYRDVFAQMARDVPLAAPLRVLATPPYRTTFFPQLGATARTDRVAVALRSVRCRGATGGSGMSGRTVVDIDMHAWKDARGLYLARQVRRMYAAGCVVRVLYGFMWRSTYRALTAGTGWRMQVRRTVFPVPGSKVAGIYTHLKTIAVSGHVGADTSAWVVWTGSENFTALSLHSDDVMMRIPSRAAYRAYAAHDATIRDTRSSATWAIYRDPAT